ncbi:MAG: type II secretion system protein N [Sphingorhabdus sp.]
MGLRWSLSSIPRLGRLRDRQGLGDWIVMAIASLCVALFANFFWIIAAPLGSIGDWKARPALTLSAADREALFASFDPFSRTAQSEEGSANVTSLSLTLFGTRFNEFTGGGSAILAGADGVQQSYSVGEEVLPGVTLSKVAFDHVILSRAGVEESLYIDQSVPAETVGEPNAAAATVLSSPAGGSQVKLTATTLRDSIGVTPRTEGGRITGLVLNARDDGAMMKNAGLASGDILVSINGRPIGSAADIAAQLRPGAKLTLEVERGSQKIPVGLNLE